MSKKTLLVLAVAAALLGAIAMRLRSPEKMESAARHPRNQADPPLPSDGSAFSKQSPSQAKTDRLSLHVVVRNQKGSPVEGAKVVCGTRGGLAATEGTPAPFLTGAGTIISRGGLVDPIPPTDGQGRTVVTLNTVLLRNEAVHFVIRAEAPGYVDDDHARYALNLPTPGAPRTIDIRLRPGKRLKGRVYNVVAEDIDQLYLKIQEVPEQQGSWYVLPKVRPDGTFATPEAPEGVLKLTLKHLQDRVLPVEMEVDSRSASDIAVTPQPNPDFQEMPRLVLDIEAPLHPKPFNYQLLLISSTDQQLALKEAANTLTPFSTTSLEPGPYRLLVVSLGAESLFADSAVSIARSGTSRFKVRLEKGGVVFINLRDSSTGRPPDQEGLRATLQWTADERDYETLGTFSVRDPATYHETGEMRANAPPGILRIVVTHREGVYKPTSIPIRMAGAGMERVSIGLIRN